MEFVEAGRKFETIPDWASQVIRFGYRFSQLVAKSSNRRIIGMISMPAPSGAVGLVLLGIVLERMALRAGNDLQDHERRMLRALRERRPLRKHGSYIRRRVERGSWIYDGGLYGCVMIKKVDDDGTRISFPFGSVNEWYVEGDRPISSKQPIADWVTLRRVASEFGFPTQGHVWKANAFLSDWGTVLVPDVRGRTEAVDRIGGIQLFGCSLSEMIGLRRRPSPEEVSRVLIYQPGTTIAQQTTPRRVVCDGIRAFVGILQKDTFRRASVLCIYNRVAPRDQLEELAWLVERLSLRDLACSDAPRITSPGIGVCLQWQPEA